MTWKIVGVDPGANTGVCVMGEVQEDGVPGVWSTGTLKIKSPNIQERFSEFLQKVRPFFDASPDLVVIEDVTNIINRTAYSRSSWILTAFFTLVMASIPPHVEVLLVTPSQLKKFATGNGKADKKQMKEALVRRLGEALKNLNEHEVDAAWLAIYGSVELKWRYEQGL